MATTDHNTLTGADLHEPKGVAAATDNHIANASSGAVQWTAGNTIPGLRLYQTRILTTAQTTTATDEEVVFNTNHAGSADYWNASGYFVVPSGANRCKVSANCIAGSTFSSGTTISIRILDNTGTAYALTAKPAAVQNSDGTVEDMSLSLPVAVVTANDRIAVQFSGTIGDIIDVGSNVGVEFWTE